MFVGAERETIILRTNNSLDLGTNALISGRKITHNDTAQKRAS